MNLLETIGPVMIGPSSSHTAGAASIGHLALQLMGEPVSRADIVLSGSFAATYRGHGTDRALIGGLMGLRVDDTALRQSLKLAKKNGFCYSIRLEELPEAHPNTALLDLTGSSGRKMNIRACSLGGGAVRVQEIDGMEVKLSGKHPTVIIFHRDIPGAAYEVTKVFSQQNINIANMSIYRKNAGGQAMMAIETDSVPDEAVMTSLRSITAVERAVLVGGNE